MTVNGSGFVSGSTVQWSGSALPTTFVSATQLTASVAASFIASMGTPNVTVQNSGGPASSPLTFTINQSVAPSLSSLSPNSAAAGTPAFILTVNGSGFVSGSTVQWNGTALPTTFVSASQLTALVAASFIGSQGTASVTVQNTASVTSNALTFTINPSGTLSLSSLSPNSATAGGAAFSLTVNGSTFVSGATVMWNGSALSTTFVSASQLTASVVASLIASQGTASVTVQNPGAGAASNALTFTISGPLSLTSLSPNSATAGGAVFTLTVNGSGFVSGTTVQWNGSALPTTFVSGSQLTASVVATLIGSQGTASVTVQNSGGTASSPLTFTISQAGTISLSSLSPNSATLGGAAFTLTVSGSGFVSGTTVQWNGSALPTTYVSASQLTASVSASFIASQGTASVTVQNPGSAASTAVTFTINQSSSAASSLSSLSPNSVAAGGPDFTLTVNGSGFLSGATLQWNGSPHFANFISGSQLTVYVPASLIASQGSVSINVRNPDGTTSNTLSFTINAPTPAISALSPNSATAGGPSFTLTINGSGFLSGATVGWNNSFLTTSFVSFNQLTASVPANLIAAQGSASVTVQNPGGAASKAVAFPINNFISSLSPASATAGAPAFTLTVNGSGFVVGSTVQWNGSPLPSTYVGGNQLTAPVSAALIASVGSASVTVVNPGGAPLGSAIFTINPPPPAILTLSPTSAAAGGAAFILTVSGSGFLNGSTVQWNGSALATTYVNGNQLTASVSAALIATIGSATVTVANAGGAASNPLTFAIGSAGNLFITTTASLPAGTIGAPYSQALAATGGVTPYKTWTVTGGNLPPGISLTAAGGAITGVPTALGTFIFTVQLTDSTNATATVQLSLTINGVPPSIVAAGINAASYAGGSVSPGEIVLIFGSGLGPATLAGPQLDSNGYLSSSLAGTQVLFDGVAAPILYTQASQVSVVVPYEVIGRTQVQVVYQGLGSNLVLIPVAAAMPGIFTRGASGHGQGSILNQDGTANSASNPAPVGSYVSVYATGEGQTNPAGIDGQPGVSPAPRPVAQPITATVGGLPAPVQYAGGAPGLVAGILQVNVQVPTGVASGSNALIVISVGGQPTQANVTVAVK